MKKIFLICSFLLHCSCAIKKPNIIFILADDLGWNDVSFHGSDEIPTPNIDSLCYNGLILNNYYTQPLCSPSRAALMTGKYPIRNGMQHNVILEPEPRGLPLNEKLLPEWLKEKGYVTRAVGKWHLGYFQKKYTPTKRGFDSHFGFWNGYQDYFSHSVRATFQPFEGLDMRRDMLTDWSTIGHYSTDLFTEEAVTIIQNHDTRNPLFLYLAHLAPHAGNYNDPLQAPEDEIAKFSYIRDPSRRIYAAMVSKLDDSVGRVTEALQKAGLLNNSIIVFSSDNGGATKGIHSNSASNYPLKGLKGGPWEGGIRTSGCLWSSSLIRKGGVSNQLMHITDWLPTLYGRAGGRISDLGKIDGFDMWESLSTNQQSPRSELLVNIDPIYGYGAIIVGSLKYVSGTALFGFQDKWYGQELLKEPSLFNSSVVTESRVSRSLQTENLDLKVQNVNYIRSLVEINCNVKNNVNSWYSKCEPLVRPCLFDLISDPCEKKNLYYNYKKTVVPILEQRLRKYEQEQIAPGNKPADNLSNPVCWNNSWTYWKDFSQPRIKICSVVTTLTTLFYPLKCLLKLPQH